MNPNTMGWWASRRHTWKQLLSGAVGCGWRDDAECSFKAAVTLGPPVRRFGRESSDGDAGTGTGPELAVWASD